MADINVRIIPGLSIEGKAYYVLRFGLDEQLSEVSVLSCELFDFDGPLPRPRDVLGKPAVFTLAADDGAVIRSFAGSIISAELAPDADDVPSLRLEVAPALWNLEKRASCRIFQEKSAVDIAKKVLEEAAVPASGQDWRVAEEHPPRVYTVQYRETDLAFMQRLLAEEGIYFAVHTKDGAEQVIFGDSPDGLGDTEGPTPLTFFEDFGVDGPAARVTHLSQTHTVRSDKVFVRDYNPETPAVKIDGSAEGTDKGPHALEVYEHPARCEEQGAAARLAKVLLDAMQAERTVVHGQTSSLGLLPGLRFSIDGHPYDSINQEHLVIRSRVEGSRPRSFEAGGERSNTLSCEFWCVPTATARYRPPRRERARAIPGAQTAITTGAAGQEIHTDKSGQVKVSFHWDREGKKDDTSSRFIRTSQVPLGGSMLLPRVGWEVTVRHIEGDADRPLVMGRMYNALTPPPYSLPKDSARSALQTATTPGGGSSNELRMADTKGSEEMFVNASKDMSTDVKNNTTESIGNDEKKQVGANQSTSVTNSFTTSVGSNQALSVGGNQSVKVETFMVDEVSGSHDLAIGGNRDLKVGGDHKRDVGGDSKLDVGGNQIDLVVGSVTHETLAGFKLDVGSASINLALGDRTVTVGGDRSETAGAAKVIAVKGGRGVEVGGALNVKTAGALVNVASGDRTEQAAGTYTEIAVGAGLVSAGGNVVFEASGMLTLVMGASILSLTPASVAILGLSAKLDGDVSDLAILIVDN